MNLPVFFTRKHNLAVLALITANIIWGAASPVFKYSLENIPVATLAFLRFFLAANLLLPFAARHLFIYKEDIIRIMLLGSAGLSLHILLYFSGLKLTPSINAPLIAGAGPIILYIISLKILKEKPHKKVVKGILVSLAGILIVVAGPLLAAGIKMEFFGNLLIFLATLSSILHIVLSKYLITRYKPITLTFWTFLTASICFLPLFIRDLTIMNPLTYIDIRGITGIIFGTVFSSLFAFVLFEYAIENIQTQEIGLFSYIDPIVAALIAMPLLGETLSPSYIIGGLFVMAGLIIAEGKFHGHGFHKDKLKH